MSQHVRLAILEIAKCGRKLMERADSCHDADEAQAIRGIGNTMALLAVGLKTAAENGEREAEAMATPQPAHNPGPAGFELGTGLDAILSNPNQGVFAPQRRTYGDT